MIYEIDSCTKLWFSDEAQNKLEDHRQLAPTDLEAGGILLGRRFVENRDVIVDEVSLPQANDRRRRHSIYRSYDHSKIALAKWKESEHTKIYLGLWHTHVERVPSPSRVDISDWENAMIRDKYEGSEMFFLIVGTEETACWCGKLSRWNIKLRPRLQLRQLNRL